MQLAIVDVIVFFGFIVAVIAVGVVKSRHEKDSESYFLAGRGLSWWLIGFSLIAANISAEQFVGMSGQAAKDDVGLAIASYEWIAADHAGGRGVLLPAQASSAAASTRFPSTSNTASTTSPARSCRS